MSRTAAPRSLIVIEENPPTPEQAQALIAQAAGPLARLADRYAAEIAVASETYRRETRAGYSDTEACAMADEYIEEQCRQRRKARLARQQAAQGAAQ
jgi:hypothetical protein